MQEIAPVGGVSAAVLQMERVTDEARVRSRQRRRFDRAIQALDLLIEDIEQLNLAGRSRVPMDWQLRLARLASELPVECGPRLRAGVSPQRLLDNVYDIQQEVFWAKRGVTEEEFAEQLPRVS
ncbi:MAG: hypothetical protein J2P38_12040 [Candidatus Dormibacteraeota bacterium]|nr:hypothetical protein [Candidatus Dormibacteraeota bacterium]